MSRNATSKGSVHFSVSFPVFPKVLKRCLPLCYRIGDIGYIVSSNNHKKNMTQTLIKKFKEISYKKAKYYDALPHPEVDSVRTAILRCIVF